MISVVLILITWLFSLLNHKQLTHYRYFLPAPLVLRLALIFFLLYMVDRNRTASRRSEPNSRTALIGEQPNPWNRLQLQDAMSRHRGAKLPHWYGLARVISLLSLAYLLSVGDDLSHSITGSLWPTKVSVWFVNLTVKQFLPYAHKSIKIEKKLP